MGFKTIDTALLKTRYLQSDSDWASLKLGDGTYNIGQVGCALTCCAMIEEVEPSVLYNTYGMTEEFCNWSKLPTYGIKTVATTSSTLFNKIFNTVACAKLPVIVFGDDGKGGTYSTHFVVVYGFKGTVSVDVDGNVMAASNQTDYTQFKVFDPSDSSTYGNSNNVEEFADKYPIKSLRVPYIK